MTKETIKIRGYYISEDKAHLKKGHPMCIELKKDYLKASYMNDAIARHINNIESISLTTYVRQKVQRICLTDSLYL
jgi:hypothetical protein